MVDRNAAFRQHFLKVAIADRIATIPAHRPQDHITLEMAPLEIRHRSVRPISAKHAQASRFLQQSLRIVSHESMNITLHDRGLCRKNQPQNVEGAAHRAALTADLASCNGRLARRLTQTLLTHTDSSIWLSCSSVLQRKSRMVSTAWVVRQCEVA